MFNQPSKPPSADFVITDNAGRSYADTIAGKYVIQPANVKGIGGFVFDYEAESQLRFQAIITEHYAEDNTAIEDHIAIRPLCISLRGFQSELTYRPPGGILGALNLVQSKLTTVPAYLGNYTPQALSGVQGAIIKAQNVVNTIDQTIARVKNIVGLFPGMAPARTKQEKAYLQLQGLFTTRQIMYVVTPYGTINNMVIESLTFMQDETTKFWSDISVSLKKINFVGTISTPNKNANRRSKQIQSTVDKGNTKGTSTPQSILFGLFGH